MKPMIFDCLMDHFEKNKPIFNEDYQNDENRILDTDSEVVAMIKEIIEARVRPHVQEDGGDIRYVDFIEETGTVILELRGSCVGCPSSSATLKGGIEQMLTYYVEEVKAVEAIDPVAE